MYGEGHETTDPLRIIPDGTGRIYYGQTVDDEAPAETTRPIPLWVKARAVLSPRRGTGRHVGGRRAGFARSTVTAVTFAAIGFATVTVVLSSSPSRVTPTRVPASREQVTVRWTKPTPQPKRPVIVISPVDVHTRVKPWPPSPRSAGPSPKSTVAPAPSPSPRPTATAAPTETASETPTLPQPTVSPEAPEPTASAVGEDTVRFVRRWRRDWSGGERRWLLGL